MAKKKKETTEKEPLTKEVKKKRNQIVSLETDYQIAKIDEMLQDFPKYLQQRADEFAKEFGNYIEKNSMSGAFVPEDASRIPYFELTQHTFKPIIKVAGVSPAYSPDQIAIAFDFYAMCTEKMNEYAIYIPKLSDFCRMLNISTQKFKEYKDSTSNEQMREICYMIEDYCASVVDDSALSGRVDKIYAMFHQKSSNSRRDNDPVVNNTFVQNNNIVSDNQLKDWERKFITPE